MKNRNLWQFLGTKLLKWTGSLSYFMSSLFPRILPVLKLKINQTPSENLDLLFLCNTGNEHKQKGYLKVSDYAMDSCNSRVTSALPSQDSLPLMLGKCQGIPPHCDR